MANFGVRHAYPLAPPPPAARPARATPAGGFVRRALRGMLRALDDAPFDLAWPPSPRAWAVPGARRWAGAARPQEGRPRPLRRAA